MAQGKKDPLQGMAMPTSSMFNRTAPKVQPLVAVQSEPETQTKAAPYASEPVEAIGAPSTMDAGSPRKEWYEVSPNREDWYEDFLQRNYRLYQSQDEAIKWLSSRLTKPRKKVSESDVVRYLLGGSLALILEHLNAPAELREKIRKVNEEGIDL